MHQQHRLFLCGPGVQCDLGPPYSLRTARHSSAFGRASPSETAVGIALALGGAYVPPQHLFSFSAEKIVADMVAFLCSACIVAIMRFQTLLPSTTSTDPTWDKLPSALYGII